MGGLAKEATAASGMPMQLPHAGECNKERPAVLWQMSAHGSKCLDKQSCMVQDRTVCWLHVSPGRGCLQPSSILQWFSLHTDGCQQGAGISHAGPILPSEQVCGIQQGVPLCRPVSYVCVPSVTWQLALYRRADALPASWALLCRLLSRSLTVIAMQETAVRVSCLSW